MKYLIAEDFAGQALAFLFPNRVNHEDMREQLPYSKILSAGFVEYKNGQFRCYGGCPELSLTAHSNDATIIEKAFAPDMDVNCCQA